MNFQTYNKTVSVNFSTFVLLLLSAAAAYSPAISLIFILGLFLAGFAYLNPDSYLRFIILFFPFAGTYYLSVNLGGLPGLKAINVVMLLALMAFFLAGKEPKPNIKAMLFLVGIIILMTTSLLKSVPYLDAISAYKNTKSTLVGYINSNLIKPILLLTVFFISATYLNNVKEQKLIIKSIRVSLALLSIAIIIIYVFYVGHTANFRVARGALTSFFGMHANTLAEFYVLGYPILLVGFLHKKTPFNTSNLIMSIICIALLYSRSVYALTIFSTFALPILVKKKAWLPVFIFIAIVGVSMAPTSVVERSLTGIDETSGVDIQKFSGGRVGSIWAPILQSMKNEDPMSLLFGRGQFSISYTTDVPWGHAHNMYIEALSDLGIFGLSFFVIFYFYFLKKIYYGSKVIRDYELRLIMLGILVSLSSWLISGMAGRHFFPSPQNLYLWILLGVGLSIIKTQEQKVRYEKEEDMLRSPKRLSFTSE